jgi:uncharacterized protein YhaN
MIIKRVHIDRFGKFDNYTMDFSDHCNVVFGSNEDGKSTIMNFIKMMFYGNTGRAADIAKNVRKRYLPWDGSKMSGSIEFVSRGIPYKLIRSFGNSNSTDQISLWNLASGEEESLPGKTEPGQKFFGIGALAFEKSVFIGQIGSFDDLAQDKDDEITQKLLNLVTTGDETVSYKKVDTRLQDAMDSLRSKRGRIGITDKKREKLIELAGELSAAKSDEETKRSLELRMESLKGELKATSAAIEKARLELELQELLEQMDGPKGLIVKMEKIDELLREYKRQSDSLESLGIDLDGAFEKRCQDALDSIRSSEELLEERTRTLEGKREVLEKLKALEFPAVTEEDVSEVRTIESEADGLKKETADLRERIGIIAGFLERKKAVDELRDSRIGEEELLSGGKSSRDEIEERLGKAKSALEAIKKRLDEEEGILDFMESNLNQARTDYKMAQQSTLNVKAMNSQRLEAAREKVRLAEAPKRYSVEETRPAKPSIALIAASILVAAVSVFLGITVNTFLYGGVAIAAAILIFAFSRKETVTSTRSQVDEEEVKLARQNLDETEMQAETEHSRALEFEEKARQSSESLEAEFKELTKAMAELRRSHADASDEYATVDKELSEVNISLRHMQDSIDSISRKLAEKESELLQLGVTGTNEELEMLNLDLISGSSRLDQLTKRLGEKLKSFGCSASDELKALHMEIKSSRKSIEEKELDVEDASTEAAKAEKLAEEHAAGFLKLISIYRKSSVLGEGLYAFAELKKEIEGTNSLKLKVESQSELLGEELGGRTYKDLEEETGRIRGIILDRNRGVIPEKMTEESAQDLKSNVEKLIEEEKRITSELIKVESDIRNRYRDKRNVSQVEDDIDKLKHDIGLDDEYYAVLEAAKGVLKDASDEVRQSFGPILNSRTADIFGRLTGGKYKNVMITRNFDINVQDVNSSQMREWKYLSSGTIDQAYLSLRLAVSDLLNSSAEELPVLLDDVLVQYDDDRAKKGLEFIADYSNSGEKSPQVILFTCHNRIVDWARNELEGIAVSYLA